MVAVLLHANSLQATAFVNMCNMFLAHTTKDLALMNQSHAQEHAAVMFHSTTKYSVADTFLSTTMLHANEMFLSTTLYVITKQFANLFAFQNADTFHVTTGELSAVKVAHLALLADNRIYPCSR
jgi:hypothetical protein